MSARYKRSFNNPHKFRLYTNSSSDLYNYQMNNIMDSFYDNAMNQSTDGVFKAVCLSGIKTEDNDFGSTNPEDGTLNELGYAEIIVKPLTAFGDMLPDPASYSEPTQINQAILLHRSMYSARSDYVVEATSMPQFGQIINCYFEQGSIASSQFTGLRFSESKVAEFHQRYLNLATIEGVQTALGAFNGANPSLLGDVNTSQLSEDNVMKKFANELDAPELSIGGRGIDSSTFGLLVQGQLDFWKGKKESTSSPQYEMLTAYWSHVGLGKNEWTPGGVPWSAAFISFQLMSYNFKAGASHYKYTENIINGLSPGWKAYSLTKGNSIIKVGDVLIRPRGSGQPSSKEYWYTHGDVVYKIEGGVAYLAGGNLGDTAKIAAKINVDSNGLATDTKNYIVTLKKIS